MRLCIMAEKFFDFNFIRLFDVEINLKLTKQIVKSLLGI